MPRDISQYTVYLLKRGRSTATSTKGILGQNTIPDTWTVDGKTYYWSGLDLHLKAIVFSEVDPRA